MIFLKIYFGKTIIDDSVAGNVQGFKNFKIWPFLQILSFKLFLIAYTLSLCHIEAPHIVRNWPNFSWIQFDFLYMVRYIFFAAFVVFSGSIHVNSPKVCISPTHVGEFSALKTSPFFSFLYHFLLDLLARRTQKTIF